MRISFYINCGPYFKIEDDYEITRTIQNMIIVIILYAITLPECVLIMQDINKHYMQEIGTEFNDKQA